MTTQLLSTPGIAVHRAWQATGLDATFAPRDRSPMPESTCAMAPKPTVVGVTLVSGHSWLGVDGIGDEGDNSFTGFATTRITAGCLGGMT